MKAIGVLLLGVLFTGAALAQGTVNFANSTTTRITTNSLFGPLGQAPNQTGNLSGAGNYMIGLYVAPQGTTDINAFTLMGPTAVNSGVPFPGLFNGNPGGAAGTFVISNNTGQSIAFQVRAWSTYMGQTWEAAYYSPPFLGYVGVSAMGEVTPSTTGGGPNLFGTGAGQVGGFVLTPWPVPEPSSIGLALLGITVGLWRFGYRKTK